jgi:hypothetical protein
MPPRKATDVLRSAIADLPRSSYSADGTALGSLHKKVCDAVDELKARGMVPEHVLLAVKAIAFDATAKEPTASVLIEKMVKWSLAQYFKDDPRASSD